MARVCVILLIITWFANSHVLLYLFPYKTHEEYYAFIAKSNIAYEIMLLLAVAVAFFETKGMLKALATFIMILVFASVIDKAIFRITTYIYSDIVLVFVALVVSRFVYGRNK